MFFLWPDRSHLGQKGLTKRFLSFMGAFVGSVNTRNWMENCDITSVKVHGRNRSQPGMCPPTTCSGTWSMRHCLGNVRHPEAAGKLMGKGLSAGTGKHLLVQFAQRLARDRYVLGKRHNATHPPATLTAVHGDFKLSIPYFDFSNL